MREKGISTLETAIIVIAIAVVTTVFAFTLLSAAGSWSNFEVKDAPPQPHKWCKNAIEITPGACITFQSSKKDEPQLVSDRRKTDGDLDYKVCLAKESESVVVVRATFTIDAQTLSFTIPTEEESSYTQQVGDMFLQRDRRRFLVRFPYWWKLKEIK